MKKFSLFGEHCKKNIYGEDLIDAILHAGPLPTKGYFDKTGQVYCPGEKLNIAKIIGVEDTSNNIKRGSKKFERVIIENTEGVRVAIDAHELTATIN
jgi:hypothetical protein